MRLKAMPEKKKYDYLVVGAGLYGAVFAHEAARHGKSVLVVEKRDHIGGNAYTECVDGIHVHRYGAHIFHTNDKRIWEYVHRFAAFNRFTNNPIAKYKGEVYSLPFNMYTFNRMWGVETPEEAKAVIERQKAEAGITEPRNLAEKGISLVGKDIFEKLIKGYTEKQWGRKCEELPSFIIERLPVRFTYDNNYFNATYQGIPVGGYTRMIEKLLSGIEIRLGVDYLEHRAELDPLCKCVVYTGPLDAFYEFCYGPLEYRTVRFETEQLDEPNFQGNAVANYTDSSVPWTRIIEHKWFQFGRNDKGEAIPHTIITKEYSRTWKPGDEPYYPVNDDRNTELYARYKELARREKKIHFGGRLAEYKYYDMDGVIAAALDFAETELRVKSVDDASGKERKEAGQVVRKRWMKKRVAAACLAALLSLPVATYAAASSIGRLELEASAIGSDLRTVQSMHASAGAGGTAAFSIEHNGKTYAYGEDIITFLVMEKSDNSDSKGNSSNPEVQESSHGKGRSEYLLVLDPTAKAARVVELIGTSSTPVASEEECRMRQLEASEMLYGIPINGYCAVDARFLPEMSEKKGKIKAKLTNELKQMKEDAKANITLFPAKAYNALKPYMLTDVNAEKVTYLTSLVRDFDLHATSLHRIRVADAAGEREKFETILGLFFRETQ